MLDLVTVGCPDTFRLNPKPSGYLRQVNGIIPREVLIKQTQGVNYTNDGHLDSHSNVNMNALQCESSVNHGPQLKAVFDIWSLPP